MIAIFPEINSCVAAGDIEKLAVLVRVYFAQDQAKNPRLAVSELLSDFGIDLSYRPLDNFATLVARDDAGGFHVNFLVKGDLNTYEKNFLLAHMLGYFLVGVQPRIVSGDFKTAGYQVNLSPLQRYLYTNNHELEAAKRDGPEACDLFAASLLMPKGMFLRAYEKMGDAHRVASFFGVATPCVERRLQWLARSVEQASLRGSARAALSAYKNRPGANESPTAPASGVLPPPEAPAVSQGVKAPAGTPAQPRTPAAGSPELPPAGEDKDRARSSLKKIRQLARLLDDTVRL